MDNFVNIWTNNPYAITPITEPDGSETDVSNIVPVTESDSALTWT